MFHCMCLWVCCVCTLYLCVFVCVVCVYIYKCVGVGPHARIHVSVHFVLRPISPSPIYFILIFFVLHCHALECIVKLPSQQIK